MTRDELVERMARAIVLSFDADPDWGSPPFWTKYREQAEAALTELEKHAVVVPAEATVAMCEAAYKEDIPVARHDSTREMYVHEYSRRYRAMIAARPR